MTNDSLKAECVGYFLFSTTYSYTYTYVHLLPYCLLLLIVERFHLPLRLEQIVG